MKLLFWIVGVPLLVAAAFFAVDNRELVSISFWPFAEPLQVQLFVVTIVPLFAGFVLGAITAWISGHRARARARSEGKRAGTLERENAALKARLEAAEAKPMAAERQAAPPAALPSSAPAPAPVLHSP